MINSNCSKETAERNIKRHTTAAKIYTGALNHKNPALWQELVKAIFLFILVSRLMFYV
jgi:hypothetical protein